LVSNTKPRIKHKWPTDYGGWGKKSSKGARRGAAKLPSTTDQKLRHEPKVFGGGGSAATGEVDGL